MLDDDDIFVDAKEECSDCKIKLEVEEINIWAFLTMKDGKGED